MEKPMRAIAAPDAEPRPMTVPSSFAEAYRDYAQRTARWAHALGGADLDVEDMVQEVFLVVSRKLASFRGDGSFASWMFEITRKVVANHRRRQRRRFWYAGTDQEELESLPSQSEDPASQLDRRRLIGLVYRALDRLPEKYRTVFVLYEIEDLSTLAIAELCQLNRSTVKVRLLRARARFIDAYQSLLHKQASVVGTSLSGIATRLVSARSAAPELRGKAKS
jgi:RNA polymerase sigma-70 factor (ECF subfamily)